MGKVVDEMLAKLHKKKVKAEKTVPSPYMYAEVSSAYMPMMTTSAYPYTYLGGSTLGPQKKE